MSGVIGLSLVACSAKQPPLSKLGEAKMAVEQAERDDPAYYSQKSLADAKAKLEAANKYNNAKEYTLARRHAEQAIVDANLARAQAELAEASDAAAEAQSALTDVQSQ